MMAGHRLPTAKPQRITWKNLNDQRSNHRKTITILNHTQCHSITIKLQIVTPNFNPNYNRHFSQRHKLQSW